VSDSDHRLGGLRILLVDDQADTLAWLAETLRNAGATVDAADSTRHAMTALRANTPDLLIADLHLPDESGYALMRKIRSQAADDGGTMPAIAITAFATIEDRDLATQAGFTEYLPKPALGIVEMIQRLTGRD
jgi:CheY-like chemotaxis protein